MRKLSRANKTILILIVLALGYLAFPWWGKLVITSLLPNELKLEQLKLSYPSHQAVSLSALILTNKEYRIEIEDAEFHLWSNNAHIKSFSITTLNQSNPKKSQLMAKLMSFSLTDLNIDELISKFSLNSLSVSHAEYQSDDYSITTNDFKISHKPSHQNGKIELTILLNNILFNQESVLAHLAVKVLNDGSQTHVEANTKNLPSFLELKIDSPLKQAPSKSLLTGKVELGNTGYTFEELAHLFKKNLSIDFEKFNQLNSIDIQTLNFEINQEKHLDGNLKTSGIFSIKTNIFNLLVEPKHHLTEPASVDLSIQSTTNSHQDNKDWNSTLHLTLSGIQTHTFQVKRINLDTKLGVSLLKDNSLKFNPIQSDVSINGIDAALGMMDLAAEKISIHSKFDLEDLLFSNPLDRNTNQAKGFYIPLIIKSDSLTLFDAESKQEIARTSINSKLDISRNNDNILKADGQVTLADINTEDWQPSSDAEIKFILSDVLPMLEQGEIQVYGKDQQGELLASYYDDFSVNADIKLSPEKIDIDSKVTLDELNDIPIDISIDLKNQETAIELLEHHIEMLSLNRLAKRFTTDYFENFEFKSGQIDYESKLDFFSTLSGKSKIKIRDANIDINENQLLNLSINGTSHIDRAENTNSNLFEGSISADKIVFKSELSINNISALVTLNSDQSVVSKSITANIFEGKVRIEKLAYTNNQLAPSLVKVSSLSLTELIFFLNLESIFATGELDFSLPIETVDSNLVIKDGQFNSVKPGVIKYDSGVKLDESENIAMKALENFNYTNLTGKINYDNTGNYQIQIRLVGANPSLYNGYPIDFTLNINGHLPGLFKTLFMTGDFEKSILDSINANDIEKPSTTD